MTVEFGTSMPTSMTGVATSTCHSPRANSSITLFFALAGRGGAFGASGFAIRAFSTSAAIALPAAASAGAPVDGFTQFVARTMWFVPSITSSGASANRAGIWKPSCATSSRKYPDQPTATVDAAKRYSRIKSQPMIHAMNSPSVAYP